MRRFLVGLAIATASLGVTANGGAAQEGLASRCATASAQSTTPAFCSLVVQIADIVPAKTGIAAAGGNPVPGAASTHGIRLGTFPRFSLAGRMTIAWATLPPATRLQGGADANLRITGWHGDLSVGLYSGLSLGPTVGGVGSIDLLGSLGFVGLPDENGLNGERLITWSAGARIGITRETFTTPGIAVSAMYRDFGEFRFGDRALQATDAYVHMDDASVWSVRGTIGKRLTMLGATGGIGYDRYSGEVLLRVRDGAGFIELRDDDVAAGRWNAFVGGTFTMLVLNATAEVGWQGGGDPPSAATSGAGGRGGLFGSLALRLAL